MKKLFLSLFLLLPMIAVAQSKKVTPMVVAKSDYVIKGSKYQAKLIPVSEELSQKARFFVNGKEIPNGNYSTVANNVGIRKQKGYMLIGNDTTHYPFSINYLVGEPTVTISNTDLNFMYSNYENKFAISVPGISNDKIKVSATGAEVKNMAGLYAIIPSDSVRTVKITVMGEINGKMQPMGNEEYRVKRLPTPQVYFSMGVKEYPSGNISVNHLTDMKGKLIASYGPDGLLSLPFKITSFTVMINGVMTKCEGNHFSKEVLDRIAKLKVGSMIVITDINAVIPAGKSLRLAPIFYTLN